MIVKTKAIVDAAVTEGPRETKGKTTYIIADDRKEEERSEADTKAEAVQQLLIKIIQPGVDTEAAWLRKFNISYFIKDSFLQVV